jgi:GT2 family glycosyltransferase
MSSKKPVFSVIIPVYNKGPHIHRSVNSVLNQTFGDFELLLINDASTDNSLEEIQNFTDPRIRILHRDQPGPGGYAARNLGIQAAHAEWVAFLDADDEWYPEHLEEMRKLHTDFPDRKVLGCGWRVYDPDDSYDKFDFDPYYVNKLNVGNHDISFVDYLAAEVAGMRPICTSIACIKTDVLLSVGGFPAGKASRGGDVDTWLRCIERGHGMAWSAHVGAVYYRDSINMVTRTKLSLAEVERESVQNLLPKYSGTEAKLLKQFANRRTISAWCQNHHVSTKRNISLFGNLYLDVNRTKNVIFLLLSLLPSSFFLSIQRLVRWLRAVSKIR